MIYTLSLTSLLINFFLMKKLLSIMGVTVLTLSLGAYALQSNGQMTSSEQMNAAMLSDGVYQSAARDFNCCSNCKGAFCGIFIHETGDTIPVNYY